MTSSWTSTPRRRAWSSRPLTTTIEIGLSLGPINIPLATTTWGTVGRTPMRPPATRPRISSVGEWNTFEITCKGQDVTLWVNGAPREGEGVGQPPSAGAWQPWAAAPHPRSRGTIQVGVSPRGTAAGEQTKDSIMGRCSTERGIMDTTCQPLILSSFAINSREKAENTVGDSGNDSE
jgi:hypothetical protein